MSPHQLKHSSILQVVPEDIEGCGLDLYHLVQNVSLEAKSIFTIYYYSIYKDYALGGL